MCSSPHTSLVSRHHGVRVLGVVTAVGESSGHHYRYGGADTAIALYAITTARAAACV